MKFVVFLNFKFAVYIATAVNCTVTPFLLGTFNKILEIYYVGKLKYLGRFWPVKN